MAATQDDVPDAKIGESSDSEVEDLLKTLSDGDMLAAVTAQNQLAQTNTAIENARASQHEAEADVSGPKIVADIAIHRERMHKRVQDDLRSTLLSKHERQGKRRTRNKRKLA